MAALPRVRIVVSVFARREPLLVRGSAVGAEADVRFPVAHAVARWFFGVAWLVVSRQRILERLNFVDVLPVRRQLLHAVEVATQTPVAAAEPVAAVLRDELLDFLVARNRHRRVLVFANRPGP